MRHVDDCPFNTFNLLSTDLWCGMCFCPSTAHLLPAACFSCTLFFFFIPSFFLLPRSHQLYPRSTNWRLPAPFISTPTQTAAMLITRGSKSAVMSQQSIVQKYTTLKHDLERPDTPVKAQPREWALRHASAADSLCSSICSVGATCLIYVTFFMMGIITLLECSLIKWKSLVFLFTLTRKNCEHRVQHHVFLHQ